MKRFILSLVFIFSFLHTFSQGFIDYQNDNRLFFGINAGGTYHTNTEIKNLYKAGISGHIGFSMFMKKDNLLSIDLRGKIAFKRYQGQAETKFNLGDDYNEIYPNYFLGLDDYKNNLSYYIPNFRNDVYSAAAELVINTNRLRQNTGLNFYIFGGFDLVYYNPLADFYSENNGLQQYYDYSLLNDLKTENILNLQDGNFESDLGFTNYSSLVPSVGLGFSYQITRSLAIFVEHKSSFSKNNIFDGLDRNIENNQITNKNDIFHFGSIGFKFHIMKFHLDDDEPEYNRVYTNPENSDDPVNNYTTPNENNIDEDDDDEIIEIKQAPVINFTQPNMSPDYTTNNFYNVKADIKHLKNRQNISFSVNNQMETNFSFNSKTDKFASTIILKEGNNTVKIHAYNNYGEDEESVIIVKYTPEKPKPPKIYFSNPETEITNTNNEYYTLKAKAENAHQKSNITLKHNNIIIPKSKYSVDNDFIITYKALLTKGENSFTVRVRNDNGFDRDICKIIYTEKIAPCNPPKITNLNPFEDKSTERKAINLSCNIVNYTYSTKFTIIHNGNIYPIKESSENFNYILELKEGVNTILIKVENECGTDISKKLQITYNKPNTGCDNPQISIISNNNSTTFNSTTKIIAKVYYVNSRNDIRVLQKSKQISFNFNPNDKSLTINNVNLELGTNTINIIAENNCGQDEANFKITREKCEKPEINIISQETTTTNYNYNFKVKLKNVNKFDIKLSVNKALQKFSFDESSGILSANIKLNAGRNIIDIYAKNDCGRELKTHNIVKEQPCDKLKYSPVKPAGFNFTSSTNKIYFQLNTQHVNISGINIKINGKATKYSFSNNQITIKSLYLNEGNNKLVINLKNDCSNKTLVYNLVYDKCEKPVITYKSETSFNKSYANISAKIDKLDGGSIKLYLNNKSKNFNYNKNTRMLTAGLSLNEGDNILRIVAQGCKTTTKTITLKYQGPCDEIRYELIQPSSFNEIAMDKAFTFKISVFNVQNSTLIVNGSNVNHNISNNLLTANFNLKPGTNIVKLNLNNSCSNKNFTFTIELKTNTPNYPVYDISSKGNFCINTSKLTIDKNYLINHKNYSYSGTVKSIYFRTTSKVEIKHKGNVYQLKSNRYYLISGKTIIKFTPIKQKGKTQWKMIIETNTLPQEFKTYSEKHDPCATSKKVNKGGEEQRR